MDVKTISRKGTRRWLQVTYNTARITSVVLVLRVNIGIREHKENTRNPCSTTNTTKHTYSGTLPTTGSRNSLALVLDADRTKTFEFVGGLLIDLAPEPEVALTRHVVNLLLGLFLAATHQKIGKH